MDNNYDIKQTFKLNLNCIYKIEQIIKQISNK